MIGYEKSGKTMDKKGWCGDDISDAAVPEKLLIFFGLILVDFYFKKNLRKLVNTEIDNYVLNQLSFISKTSLWQSEFIQATWNLW